MSHLSDGGVAGQCTNRSSSVEAQSKISMASRKIARWARPTDTIAELSNPEQWGEEESYTHTKTYSGLGKGTWQPSPLGGSDVCRSLQLYAADYTRIGVSRAATCIKHQRSLMNLLPGCFLFWCLDCGACVGRTMMHSAESVRHPFEYLVTRCKELPKESQMDNGCNLYQYALAREGGIFKGTHVSCIGEDTEAAPRITARSCTSAL